MGFVVKFLTILLLGISSAAVINEQKFLASLNSFNQDLFSKFVKSHPTKNIIYSPFSIQTCLAMTRMGAEGQTAVEMDHGLGFTGQTPESVADNYHTMLAKYADSDIVTIANKVYVMNDYQLQDNYNELLSQKFFSSAENIDFAKSMEAASAINTWVEEKTDNNIKDLISADALNSDTRLVLLNAIHFSGKWATEFKKEETTEMDFYTDETNSVKVPMMSRKGKYIFMGHEGLEAYIVRLPYKNSDLSMLVFVPFSRTGFPELQKKLKHFPLKSLEGDLRPMELIFKLPKFKAEFQIKLNNVLWDMGMKKMFGDADFGKMLKNAQKLAVSEVIHKAVIEVNEEGTEAAAATAVVAFERSGPRIVAAEHPFIYAIVNEDYVPIFQGSVVGF